MRLYVSLLIACAVAWLTGCASPPKITTDYDHATNFSQYHTYDFAPLPEGQYQTLTGNAVQFAVSRQLESRGYKRSITPDLLVYSNVTTQNKVQVDNNPGFAGPGIYAGWWGYNESVWSYTEGTLTVDLVDSKKKQLIWRGTASDIIDPNNAQKLQPGVQKVVDLVFARYPFLAGQ